MEEIKKKVQKWWNSSPCCSNMAKATPGTRQFHEEIDAYKDTYEPFTNRVADYVSWNGKSVLEIGCGLGKDFSRFASAGALATSIDMSIESLKLTKKRFEIFGLKGNLCLADAENLPFKDGAFDLVFSWGVFHHTPNTQKAISEAHRCAKPGGKIIVMLYNRYSFLNLQCNLMFLRRNKSLRRAARLLLPWKWFKKPQKTSAAVPDYSTKDELLAAFTDGVGNPLSKVYSKRGILKMFSAFYDIRISAYEPRGSRFMKIFKLFPKLENRLGWFMVIEAKKYA